MVGIDFDYKKSKAASISIWRLKISLGDDGQPEGEVIQELKNEVNSLATLLTKSSYSETPRAIPSFHHLASSSLLVTSPSKRCQMGFPIPLS